MAVDIRKNTKFQQTPMYSSYGRPISQNIALFINYFTVNHDEWFLIWGLSRSFCSPFHLTTVFNYDSDCERCCCWLWQLTRYKQWEDPFQKWIRKTKKENLQIHSKLGISSPTHASQEYDRQLYIRRWQPCLRIFKYRSGQWVVRRTNKSSDLLAWWIGRVRKKFLGFLSELGF